MSRRIPVALLLAILSLSSAGMTRAADAPGASIAPGRDELTPSQPDGIVDRPPARVIDVGEAAAQASCSSLLGDIPNTIVVSGEPTLAAAYRVTGKQLGRYVENKPRNLGIGPRQRLDMCIFDGDFVTTTSGPVGFDTSAVRVLVIVAGPDHRFLLRVAKEESGIPLEDPSAEGEPDLLSRLVTEELEPGVLRVISDGYRELSRDPDDTHVYEFWSQFRRTHVYRHVEAAPDGSVWVMDDGRFFGIGEDVTYDLDHQPRVHGRDDIEVAPDGTLWRVASIRLAKTRA